MPWVRSFRLRQDGRLYSGHAADTDVVVAAAQAFVNALNRLVSGQNTAPCIPSAPLPRPSAMTARRAPCGRCCCS